MPIALLTQKRARSEAANPDLVDAKGRRFCYFQEPDNGERINIGLMKELTGGDKIKGRTLFKLPIEFKPQFKLALLCNDLPEMPGNDDGTWRRVRVVRFKSKFRENPDPKDPYEFKVDTTLPDKFENWAEPFMYMLLQYYKKYKQNGLFEPPEVKWKHKTTRTKVIHLACSSVNVLNIRTDMKSDCKKPITDLKLGTIKPLVMVRLLQEKNFKQI